MRDDFSQRTKDLLAIELDGNAAIQIVEKQLVEQE